MSIRTRDQLSSQELSPEPKHHKMADDSEPTVEMIYRLLKEVQSNTQSLVEDNKQVKKDIRELKESLSYQCNRVEELEKENRRINMQADVQKNLTQSLNNDVLELNRKIRELETQQDVLEQYNRKHNLIITGIPEHREENLEEAIKELGDLLNVPIEQEEIDIVHRLKGRGPSRPVIVKFVQYSAKRNLYMARKKLRNLSPEKFEETNCLHGASKIFINENLTAQRGALFSEVRKKVRQYGWHSSYTMDGKIFVKKYDGGKAHKIESQSDFEFLYNE